MSDHADGTVQVQFLADAPLPAQEQDYTPAQLFAVELKKSLLENGNIVQ